MINQQNPNPNQQQINNEFLRRTPESSLDFNMQMIESAWGKESIPDSLKQKLTEIKKFENLKTKEISYTREDLWSLLGFYTRDLRLGNIDKDEFIKAEYFLNLANDLLKFNFINPFMIALSRVATILELSQSKQGFLRRRNNTLTTEQYHTDMQPPKKSLFGKIK